MNESHREVGPPNHHRDAREPLRTPAWFGAPAIYVVTLRSDYNVPKVTVICRLNGSCDVCSGTA